MALITGTALVAIVWQGAVRIVGSKLAKELVKVGAKHLTKKNFKKSYEFFKGNKKIKTSEKNKILEDLNIVTPKVKKVSKVPKVPKKEVKKPEKDLLPGIKPEESVYAYYTRMAKESRILADKKIPKAPKKDIVKKPEAPKVESEATKVAKLKEAPKVDRIRMEEKTKEVLSTSGKKVTDATVKQSLASKAWEKAKAAMKIAGWGGVTVAGGGLIFYMLDDDKVPDTKLDIDLESEITEIQDKSVTIAEPEKTDIITPPITHHITKKNIAEKLQTLDFNQEGVTVITEDHPAIPKRIPIPGYSNVITDVGN